MRSRAENTDFDNASASQGYRAIFVEARLKGLFDFDPGTLFLADSGELPAAHIQAV